MEPLLSTKLYIPPARTKLVNRTHLLEQLNEGLDSTPAVTLISAPAGFGKSTLLGEWVSGLRLNTQRADKIANPVAWLSLDEGDKDPARFFAYLLAALQTIAPDVGKDVASLLQSPQPPPAQLILTALLNDLASISDPFLLVLDDYHVIDSPAVDRAITFLLDHQPPQMHLVIATREDPDLPLARLRASGQLTELRAADLRFTQAEAAEFLNQVMGLRLSAQDIAALEERTEGWIAGLQLAALSMQGQKDTSSFIQSFTGSHRYVLDYLMEEVLHRQPEPIQTFLLRTSILERMCASLCDAVVGTLERGNVSPNSDPRSNAWTFQRSDEVLKYLERSNLFIVPLDDERRWYRYHHLFADLLRQRLPHSFATTPAEAESRVNELHIRASQWYEENGLDIEAFQHAAAASDIDRAERIIDKKGIPLHFRGAITPILDWLASLPDTVRHARPSLLWRHAALLLINGQTAGVAENLQAAEAAVMAALGGGEPDEETRNLIGRIATATATLALTRYDVETMLVQSRRALEYLDPTALFNRASATWTMGFAYTLLGDRVAARQAFMEAISLSQAAGAPFTLILAMIGLGQTQEFDNQLYQAAETYRHVLALVGDKPQQIIGEAHLGLARLNYEWNELDAAEQHARQSLQLARQYESFIDRFVISEVFLARLKLAQGDTKEAASVLAKTDQSVRQYNFMHRVPEVAAAQVLVLLRQNNVAAAAQLAQMHNLPLSQARVHLVQENPSGALAVLEPFWQLVEAKDWKDEKLKTLVMQAVAHHAQGEKDKAVQLLKDALILAEPGGFIRTFIDEGPTMADLLRQAAVQGIMPDYVNKLLAAWDGEKQKTEDKSQTPAVQTLIEPLSQRELEVLRLVAQGLSNEEIGRRLFLALDTVKGHNRRIYDKLQVQRRTEAVARARELGLL